MLNLQATDKRSTGETSSISSQLESVVFQRVVGSLGSAVEYGNDLGDDVLSRSGDTEEMETTPEADVGDVESSGRVIDT